MEGAVFLDTSGLYALADKHDVHHVEAASIAAELRSARRRVFTTCYVLAETHTLILSRLGHHAARGWLKGFNVPLEETSTDDLARAKEIILKWEDKAFSFTDAISFAVMERCCSTEVLAFDEHFEQYGYRCIQAGTSP